MNENPRNNTLSSKVVQRMKVLDAGTREEHAFEAQMPGLVHALLESASDAMLITAVDGAIVDHNDNYLRLWRLAPRSLRGVRHVVVLEEISRQFADPAAFLARIEAIYASPNKEERDVLHLADRRVIERVSRKSAPEGNFRGHVWSFRDVTEQVRLFEAHLQAQRQLEELNEKLEERVLERTKQLQRSEQQFEQLVAGVRDAAIFMLDRTGTVVSWNTGAARIKGYTDEEIIGKHFSVFYTPEDRAAGVPQQALLMANMSGKYDAEGWRVRKDGTKFWASVLIDSLRAPDGTLIGFAKVTRDMTERRAILEQLHQSQKMEAIGQLTGGVAHDFNNLLTVILGNLDTLLRQIPSNEDRWRRAIDQAARSAQRAATLTQQLLAFARRQPLNPKPTDVNRLVRNMSDLIRRTLSENIALQSELAASLWHVEIDAHQLESALLNLAVNARDAMPEGGKLTIETANVHLDESYVASFSEMAPGEYVLICMSDTGTGMPEEVVSRAFDPFFTTKPVGKGTGLGLSQVFGFVKQSGGHVRLQSEVGVGTTVKIYLPRLVHKAETAVEESRHVEPVAYGTETILVVEDEESVRMYSTESLRDFGFTVLEAPDGQTALHVLRQHPEISLLFTDVGLPGLNGRELVEEARRLHPDLKVLFTTGYARDAFIHQGRLEEGVDLLTKPFTRAQLGARIRDVLDAERSNRSRQPLALVVEDEPLVRMFVLEALTDMGFTVIQAGSAREGFMMAERNRDIELALVDVGLPDRSGLQLAADLRAAFPKLGIAIASGYGQELTGTLQDEHVVFLSKPFRVDALKEAVHRLGSALS